ncbi:NAD-dependent epimerase/dehydratase family protein [Agrobacterium rhizogenes]|uniref:NAD dependent epimerase/dehydratase family protein n=1 Tax=Rhizobium rhizogenes TaxID=359 RepID=A0A7S4ZUB9_RHIRH|nr:NAD-dependent epimerase/dehydratase family protein [Rhizobium rhizogenes]NTF59388.1 NAD-dependent epimerase/dehydratase family protein [Rhizobium rhizogenes]NTF78973.1 NAD-dependent epimerase/dehydratase family protein [Rhizobium rhizogenes]NTJ51502.1 NAD-dependent epimerase/dehydratase family protein [Rhizobium rhizogenes]QCL10260.1 NAD dependent epimerase/dehydratase family protein [Rhizobium rhizogenes]
MKVVVTGGDGFCGWPTTLHLANRGHEVLIIDDGSRRRIANDLTAQSLTPIVSLKQRVETWNNEFRKNLQFQTLNIAEDYEGLRTALREFGPHAIVHLAAQRSAPYSMGDRTGGYYTLFNNILSIQNILHLISTEFRDVRLVHLGSIGVYGYSDHPNAIPEGLVEFRYDADEDRGARVRTRFPVSPGSLYHTSKAQIGVLLDYYHATFGLDLVDLYQGIVWGTQTPETLMHKNFVNRFDYDEYYGTVVNRFLVQGSVGLPLSVYGKGMQTRAFIHIADTVKCIEAALLAKRRNDAGVQVYHQTAETLSVRAVAEAVARFTGAEIDTIANPRGEVEDHRFSVVSDRFRNLGLRPRTLAEDLLQEMQETVFRYSRRLNADVIAPRVVWGRSVPKHGEQEQLEQVTDKIS